jgi:hypothetical protein
MHVTVRADTRTDVTSPCHPIPVILHFHECRIFVAPGDNLDRRDVYVTPSLAQTALRALVGLIVQPYVPGARGRGERCCWGTSIPSKYYPHEIIRVGVYFPGESSSSSPFHLSAIIVSWRVPLPELLASTGAVASTDYSLSLWPI